MPGPRAAAPRARQTFPCAPLPWPSRAHGCFMTYSSSAGESSPSALLFRHLLTDSVFIGHRIRSSADTLDAAPVATNFWIGLHCCGVEHRVTGTHIYPSGTKPMRGVRAEGRRLCLLRGEREVPIVGGQSRGAECERRQKHSEGRHSKGQEGSLNLCAG